MLTAGVKGRVEMFRRLGLAVPSEEIEMGGIVDERKLAGGPGGC